MTGNYWESRPERWLLPGMYQELAKFLGWDEAVRVGLLVWDQKRRPSKRNQKRTSNRAGTIYVPMTLEAQKPAVITELLGKETARILIKEFPGHILEFPCIEAASIPRRNAAVVEQVRQYKQTEVAARFGITVRTVGRIVADDRIRRGQQG